MNHYIRILEANASGNVLDFRDKLISYSSLTLYLSLSSTIATAKSMSTAKAITITTVVAIYQNSDLNL